MPPANQNIELPINTELLNQVKENHYAVVDDFLPKDLADQLLSDAERLYSNFQQHYFQFGGVLLKKPNVRCKCSVVMLVLLILPLTPLVRSS